MSRRNRHLQVHRLNSRRLYLDTVDARCERERPGVRPTLADASRIAAIDVNDASAGVISKLTPPWVAKAGNTATEPDGAWAGYPDVPYGT